MISETTEIYNEQSFYSAFIKDMLTAESEVIIYSPFISRFRADYFRKILIKLLRKNIKVVIFTRPIAEHEEYIQDEVRSAIKIYEEVGVNIIFLPGSIHEKVAIIDKKTIWTGSMNILSQRYSKEIMTRVQDKVFTEKIISHLQLNEKARRNTSTKISLPLLTIKNICASLLAAVRGIMIILVKSLMAIFKIVDVVLR